MPQSLLRGCLLPDEWPFALRPPTSTFSVYNVITAPKTLDIFKGMGRPRVPQLTVVEREWLLRQVGMATDTKN